MTAPSASRVPQIGDIAPSRGDDYNVDVSRHPQREHVLVVDDELDALELLSLHLTGLGLEVVQASDGIDAISSLYARLPRAIVLDVMMPRMDGIELITQIRSDRRLAGVPILAVSGAREGLSRAKTAGANATMLKPLDLRELGAFLLKLEP